MDIMRYGMDVIMDVINMSVELHDRHKGGGTEDLIDLSEPASMEG